MSAASPSREATIVLNAEGQYVDASPLALELLGVDLATLLASLPGDFRDPEANPVDEARRANLIRAVPGGLIGETTVRRADGSTFRARFTVTSHPEQEGHMVVTLEPISAPAGETVVRTLPEILEEWRQADRELETLEPGTDAGRATQARAEELRGAYQRLSRARRDSERR